MKNYEIIIKNIDIKPLNKFHVMGKFQIRKIRFQMRIETLHIFMIMI